MAAEVCKRVPSTDQLTLAYGLKVLDQVLDRILELDACSRKCSATLAQNDHSTLTRNVALHKTLQAVSLVQNNT